MNEVKHENLQCLLWSFYNMEEKKLFIVCDFMGGRSLAEVIKLCTPLTESTIVSVNLQVGYSIITVG
jgi:serine/threonine protein phosphatase PrpC